MNPKLIGGVALIIILALGGGAYYMNKSKPTTEQQAQGTQATNPVAGAGNQATPGDPDKVQAQDVKVGTGKEAAPGTKVSVLYVGMLQDGTVFDSSAAHNNEPLAFTLGEPGLIPGFQIGVNGMKEGGERLMAIPAALGYGDQEVKDPAGKVVIPAKSTIVFRVQLVKVEQVAAAAGAAPAKK